MVVEVNVEWIWKENGKIKLQDSKKKVLQEWFIKAYRIFCDAVNPMYKTWNEETEILGFGGSEDPNSEYMKYIVQQQNKLMHAIKDRFDETFYGRLARIGGILVDFYSDEEACFHMRVRMANVIDSDVSFVLRPV